MATRKRKAPASNRKKTSPSFELTRIKLLYGLSGVFTLCVVGLLMARPTPLTAAQAGAATLAATMDPLESAIGVDGAIEKNLWTRIVIERADSLATGSFHFAVLPQSSGDQIAISPEWGRQREFGFAPGELRIALVSADPARDPRAEKTIRLLVERLQGQLRISSADIIWR